MTTVLDPFGSPVVIFNKTGLSIFEVSANGNDGTNPAVISSVSSVMVVNIILNSGNTDVELPDNADIGDTIEMYSDGGGARIYPASGDSIEGFSPYYEHLGSKVKPVVMRRYSSTHWRIVSA